MNAVIWKLNRLSLMRPDEIAWRARKAVRTRWERLRDAAPAVPTPSGEISGRCWLTPLSSTFDTTHYLAAADRIMAGCFDLFALRGIELGMPPLWNRDPKSGTIAPLRFGKLLNYRDEHRVGDIKYLWELNRHYELVTLAQAFYLTRRAEYADTCRLLLESWFDQCPYPLGQAWSSALENAIRLTNWAVAWSLLEEGGASAFSGADGKRFRQRWLDEVYLHCRFIAGHFSLHSSANNHLAGEYMGLFIAALRWPCWDESQRWAATAKSGLEQEALKQNAPDGVNREQGIWYHHEVADMMLLSALFGKTNGVVFSAAYWARLEAMLEFIAGLMDAGGNMPMIGDSDDAVMVRFAPGTGFDAYRSLLATGAVLFDRGDFKQRAGSFDDKSRWLLGDQGAADFAALNSISGEHSQRRAFPDGGYYVLGQCFGTPSEVKAVADAGPLGYLSIAAHGHADALAFTLSAGGHPLLIDPGTYAYHTQKKWRGYFRGTSAHNTVRVDGLDQSQPGGNFMWLSKANARCEHWQTGANEDCFVGSHDGYLRLPDPLLHRRRLVWRQHERMLLVEDLLECRAPHHIEFFWHFPDTCRVTVHDGTVRAQVATVLLEMTMPDCSCVPEPVTGRESPPLGWTSRRFDEKTPSTSIVWSERIPGATRRLTVLRLTTVAAS